MLKTESILLPDFNGRDAAYRNFRTRISNGLETGPNFSGHYSIIEIGCGTSCRFAFVANARTGEVFEFPFGGTENYEMTLNYSVKSKVVRVRWSNPDTDQCVELGLLWTGLEFVTLNEAKTQRVGSCSL